LVATLTEQIAALTAAGDHGAARVALQALNRLMAEGGEGGGNATAVLDLNDARARRRR
jgi:predicted RNA-binding protein Jag